jgi:hypothetical protein
MYIIISTYTCVSVLSFAAINAQLLYPAPGHLVCTISGYRQYVYLMRVQVVVLVLDGSELRLRRMELALADMIYREGRGLVVAANKSDLLIDDPRSAPVATRRLGCCREIL